MPRAQPLLATLILATAISPSVARAQGRGPFDDVPQSHWAANDVTDLAKRGVFTGYTDGAFKGKRAVSRHELAVGLQRVFTEFQRMTGNRTVPAIQGPRGEQGPAGPQGPQGPAGPMGPPGTPPEGFAALSSSLDDLQARVSASRDLSQALLDRMRAIRARLREVDAELAGLNDRTRRIKPSPIR